MSALIWSFLSLMALAPSNAPGGWQCKAEQALGLNAKVELSDELDRAGSSIVRVVDVMIFSQGSLRSPLQSMRWYLSPGQDLSRPSFLSVTIALDKWDRKASVRLEQDGTIMLLPAAMASFGQPVKDRAFLGIRDPQTLQKLWAARQWRLSVVDRHGRLTRQVDNALPSRPEVEQALAALSPLVASKAASRETQCVETSPAADI